MTLIIGIFTRDNHDNKEIFFASDGLALSYKNNKKIGQDANTEKIRKLTPKPVVSTHHRSKIFKSCKKIYVTYTRPETCVVQEVIMKDWKNN